ncbi:hypothetical protein X805_22570 [Sphaerotilus natans subsp. natans DSM 6575]|uniref:Uncharacterized protein n=1 Tax=Sphaerotilus natans subsp. natans DSM 6575 TaxID=1286631 RepID=A0A059KL05_9BURK|nr:hypothetical protein X805_22570 [Sphaerotilus natans subsp. natans DSM 6575]
MGASDEARPALCTGQFCRGLSFPGEIVSHSAGSVSVARNVACLPVRTLAVRCA